MAVPRYEAIGYGYARTRREDPQIMSRLLRHLESAQSVVNVGAGPGSYEPVGKHVLAVEPSETMARQRPAHRPPAVRAEARALPLFSNSVDAAMSILSVHHWDEHLEEGLAEMRRVARGPVLILTYDPAIGSQMWLLDDYLPEVATQDASIFKPPSEIGKLLGRDFFIETVPLSRDTPDWMLGSFWAHPERVLDPDARQATSGFARLDKAVVDRVVAEVSRDLESGQWDKKHGHLRDLDEYDVGLRLVVAHP